MGKTWREDLQHLSATLKAWCPDWQPHRGKLLGTSKEATAMAIHLCKNERYPKIAAASAALKDAIALVRSIGRDGCGAFLESSVVKAAESVVSLAIETVAATYCVFKLRVEIPRIANAALKEVERNKVRDFRGGPECEAWR